MGGVKVNVLDHHPVSGKKCKIVMSSVVWQVTSKPGFFLLGRSCKRITSCLLEEHCILTQQILVQREFCMNSGTEMRLYLEHIIKDLYLLSPKVLLYFVLTGNNKILQT